MSRLAHEIAIECEKMSVDIVESTAAPILARAFAVTSVPRVVTDDGLELLGSQTEEALVAAVCGQIPNSDT